MIPAPEILRCDLVYRLGWALLHSLWQIALLAFVVAALLAAFRRRSANLRYVVGCAGLAVMFILPVVTYCVVPAPPRPELAAVAIPPGNPPAVSVDPSPPRTGPPQGTVVGARPPESEPSVPSGAWESLPLASRPSPELTASAEPATRLPARVSQALLPWVPWFVMFWLVGVFLLSVWHLGGWIAMQRLKYLGTTPGSELLTRQLAELMGRMRLGRPVRMLQSVLVDVPAVIGWLRPVLLVPAAMLGELSPQQIDAVLAHELAHVRRYDYLVNLLQTLIETLLFYHPAVWWLSRRIRIERENCCDDAAVALCGSRVDYAATLMALEQGRMAPRLAVAASRADRAGTALSRVRRVLGVSVKDSLAWRTSWGGTLGALLLIGILVGYVAAGAARDQGPGENTALPSPAANTAAELLDDFKTAKEFWIQAEVAKKLIALGDKSILPEVAQMLKSEDRRTRCNAGWVLAGLGDERGLVAVLVELKDTGPRPTKLTRSDGKPNVPGQIQQDRYYAVHVLGEIGDRRAVPELIETLKDDSINYKAAIVLGSLGDRRAIPALKEMLNTCKPDHRLWAGSGLAKLGDPLGVPTVAEFLKHPQWTQRRHAADALGESQDKRALPALTDALKDKQTEVRVSAARALGRLADRSAIPPLEAMLDDRELTTSGPPTAVRDAAAEAIRQIRGAGQPTARAATQPKLPAEGAAADWGPAVEGVQVRLRAGQSKWTQGIVPRLAADVRNAGKRDLSVARAQQLCELEVDGRWYRWAGGMDVKSSGFPPGRQYDDIPVSLGSDWASDGKPLILGPGKHSIRVAFIARNDAGGPVRAVSNPVEIEITAEKIQWGQKAEGLQAGLVFDMQERPYHVGELVSFRLYVRNMGYKAVELVDSVGVNPPRDDAPLIGWAPSVHDAAGKPLPVGMAPMDIPVLKRRRSLPAGETMLVGTVSLRLDSRPDRGSTPFLSLQPGTYRVSQKYRFSGDPEATWSGELASGELELKVAPAEPPAEDARTDWGPAVEGVQCRIQPDKKTWNAAETPTCRAFVRHQGTIEVWLSRVQMPESGLEVDGVWYRHPQERIAGAAYQRSSFWEKNPGVFQFALDKEWVAVEGGKPLALSPGKHAVRYAWAGFHAFYRPRISPVLYDQQRPVRLVTNLVEIEIVADEPGSGAEKTAEPSAEVYRKHVANLVLPQRDDPYLPSQKWLREHLTGAVPYLLEARIRYKDQFTRIPVVTHLLFEAWEAGLLSDRQKRTLLEHTLLVAWDVRQAYPPGYAGEAMVNFRGVSVPMGQRPLQPGDPPPGPLGPEGILKAVWRVELDGKQIRRDETCGSDGFLLRLPEGLQPGGHKLEAILEVSERGGGWSHTWSQSGQLRIDPELKPESIVAPGSETFPQEKAVQFVEGPAKQFEWDSGRKRFLVTAPAINIEPLVGSDLDIVARLPIEVEIDGKVFGKPHYYGGFSYIDGHSPPDREFTFQPSPDVPLRPGKFRWRIALVPDLHWAWTQPGVDRLCNRRFVSPWYDAEIETLPAAIQWGRETEGLRAGLTFDPQDRPYHVGELVSFRLYVRNLSGKTVALVDFGTTGWMPTVSDSAGKPVMVAGQFDGPVQRRRQTLPDGQTLLVGTVTLMLDKSPEARARQPFHVHLEPGTYHVSQKYRFSGDPEATWSGELASGELELKVVPAEPPAEGARTDWGPAVQGVQCRLEADKPTWKPAEMLTLKACVRHQTESMLFLSNHPMFGAQLEVDGHWHRWNTPVAWAGPSHSRSNFRTKDQQPLAITLDANWSEVDNKEPLVVDPGRHVIRFAWEGHPEKGPREGPDEQRSIVLLSNPLEIIVPPERPQPKPSEVHADDRNAAAALWQLGAILAADDQGKIRSVRLSRTAVTDADLGHLKGLSALKAIYLDDTRITSAGLQHLAGLTGLETLSINYTRIGDAGLEHLKGLKGLRSLALLDTEVTAAGLRGLKKLLPNLLARVDPLKLSGLGDLHGWRNSAKLDDDYELVSVDLLDANISDASLELLKGRQSLQDVCLAKANVTDAGLAELRKLTDLHTLYLSGTRITDAGLDCLKDMTKLKTLFLADTQIGDAGLARLSHLTNLESLLIDGTQVTDAGLAHLRPFKMLTLLRLNNCQISGTGLSHLRDLTRLTALELRGTAVSDTGLAHLQPFVNLELLYLSRTSVTDAGLGYLTGLRKLRVLEIQDTAITDDGIQRLKRSLPNTSIHR